MTGKVLLTGVAALALTGGIAGAHGTSYVSEVIVEDGGVAKGHAFAYGFVASKANVKCIKNRDVDLRAVNKGGPHAVIDEAVTSKNGGFYMFGPVPNGFAAVVVKMAKAELSPNKTCKGDAELVAFIP